MSTACDWLPAECERKIMKSAVSAGLTLLVLLAIPAATVSAQLWVNNQQMMFEDGNFNHFAASNPNLVNDPRYLASHPQLMAFMRKYPYAATSLRSNPQAFLRHDTRSANDPHAGHHHHHDDHWHY
jgi:hypothetical protein